MCDRWLTYGQEPETWTQWPRGQAISPMAEFSSFSRSRKNRGPTGHTWLSLLLCRGCLLFFPR